MRAYACPMNADLQVNRLPDPGSRTATACMVTRIYYQFLFVSESLQII